MANNTIFNRVGLYRWHFNGVDLYKAYFNGVLVFNRELTITIKNGYTNTTYPKSSIRYIKLDTLINAYRKHGEMDIIILVPKGVVVPTIMTGGMPSGVKSITLKNYGEIQAAANGWAGLYTQTTYKLLNYGWIRGSGGTGGTGHVGAVGATGKTLVKTTHKPITKIVTASGKTYAYWEGIDNAQGVNPCDYVYWGGKSSKHCSGKVGTIPGVPGVLTPGVIRKTISEGGFGWNVRDIVHKYDQVAHTSIAGGKGGTGGTGGAGGAGQWYKHPAVAGSGGHTGGVGHASVPAGGYTGGRGATGYKGGHGGVWGRAGDRGYGSGSAGAADREAINGHKYLVKGSVIGHISRRII